VSGQVGDAPEPVSEAAPEAPSRLLYRALIGLVIVVVATVIGYVAGPAVDKRWAPSPQASQRPVSEPAQAVPAVSREDVSDRTAVSNSLDELQKLAAQGDADAQWQLGVRYHSGETPDDAKAVQWFQRAAEQGNVAAQSALGAYYWSGRGVPKDLSKAYFWSTVAMAQGDEMSKARIQGLARIITPTQASLAHQQAELWIRSHSQRAKSESN
jgi:TPR repeat protein